MRAGDGAGSTVSAASLTAHESALALHDVPKKVACDGEQIHLHGIDAQIVGPHICTKVSAVKSSASA